MSREARDTSTAEEPALRRPWDAAGAIAGTPGLIALVALALAGSAVAVYLITVEARHVPLICSTSGLVDCASVLNSSYSRVPFTDMPITVPGLLWFVVSGGLAGVGLARARQGLPEPRRLRLAQFVWSALGLVFVLYLVYAEIVRLHRICAWCTVIHVLTLITFLLALQRLQQPLDAAAREAYRPRINQHPSARNARGRSGGVYHGAAPSRRSLARSRGRR